MCNIINESQTRYVNNEIAYGALKKIKHCSNDKSKHNTCTTTRLAQQILQCVHLCNVLYDMTIANNNHKTCGHRRKHCVSDKPTTQC